MKVQTKRLTKRASTEVDSDGANNNVTAIANAPDKEIHCLNSLFCLPIQNDGCCVL